MSLHAERSALLRKSFKTLDLAKVRKVFPQVDEVVVRLERIQDYSYADKHIAVAALLHRSALVYWPTDKSGIASNERLEFLGDAYLNFFVATEAMLAYPDLQEGQLSRLRAAIVGTENLAEKARESGLGDILLLGKGEMTTSGQRKSNALADAFEAVSAALFVDGGEAAAGRWLSRVFAGDLLTAKDTLIQFDVKTKFQQWTQSILGQPPTYRVVGTVSTPHETQFIVAGFVGDTELARASAPNKRDASKLVAAKMQRMVDAGDLTADLLKSYFHNGKEI